MRQYSQEYLEHHGILGMHWGIRKPEPIGMRRRSSSNLGREYDAKFSQVRKHLLSAGLNERALKDKYGPDTNDFKAFVTAHKTGVKRGVEAGLTIAALAAMYYAMKPTMVNQTTMLKAYVSAVDGLALNWDAGVDLAEGSIIKRVSTTAESNIRPGGFFGAFLDSDVESYKGILPGFWGQWGVGFINNGGYVNHYQALSPVKAPSGSETLSIFKELVHGNDAFLRVTSIGSGLEGRAADTFSDAEWKTLFSHHSLQWAGKVEQPATTTFFDAIRSKGYNALIDFNDAGKLAKTPIRTIDGSMYKIVKNETLDRKQIMQALAGWSPSLVHFLVTMDALIHTNNIDYIFAIKLTNSAVEQGTALFKTFA